MTYLCTSSSSNKKVVWFVRMQQFCLDSVKKARDVQQTYCDMYNWLQHTPYLQKAWEVKWTCFPGNGKYNQYMRYQSLQMK